MRIRFVLPSLFVLAALACDAPRAAADAAPAVAEVPDGADAGPEVTAEPLDAATEIGSQSDARGEASVAGPDAEKGTSPDVEDPYCHYDCFGGHVCNGGVVTTFEYLPVPCAYWQGSCPVQSTLTCPFGCKYGGASADDGAEPQSLCQPCADPKKTGAACDECADPKRTGADCDTCIDPAKHGPSCDLCLGGPGSAGCPCVTHEECIYDVCLDSAAGKRCAKGCSTAKDCPTGMACALMGTGYPSACTPLFGYLCKACSVNADCALPGQWDTVCAALGKPGLLQCTRLCESDAGCPAGFSCALAPYGESMAKLCKPEVGAVCE